MEQFRAIDLNQDVYVILTENGEKILEERHNRMKEVIPSMPEFNIEDYLCDKYYICPLWELLETFGPDINTGNIIKNNIIVYKQQ